MQHPVLIFSRRHGKGGSQGPGWSVADSDMSITSLFLSKRDIRALNNSNRVLRDWFVCILRRSESSSHSMLLTCNRPVQDPFPPGLLHKSSARNNYNVIISVWDVTSSASQARVLFTSCTPFSASSGCDETLLAGMYVYIYIYIYIFFIPIYLYIYIYI